MVTGCSFFSPPSRGDVYLMTSSISSTKYTPLLNSPAEFWSAWSAPRDGSGSGVLKSDGSGILEGSTSIGSGSVPCLPELGGVGSTPKNQMGDRVGV